MNIFVNGKQQTLPAPETIEKLLAEWGYTTGIAVAINGAFVPRTTYAEHIVKDGDAIEILSPRQGG